MEIDIRALLEGNPLILLFATIGLGYLIGNIKFGSIKVGSTAGVLLVGLTFGHFGHTIGPLTATFGFTLFIFSVGLQAGPSFFSALMSDGRRYIMLALVVGASAFGLAVLLSKLMGFEYGLGAGLLAGALTSTPTLAGAQDAISSGLAAVPDGMTAKQVMNNIGAGYAITYIFGTVGLILFVRYFPKILKIDLSAEARALEQKRGLTTRRRPAKQTAENVPVIRAFKVGKDGVGQTIEQRHVAVGRQGQPLKLRRGNNIMDAKMDIVLEEGDIVSVVASLAFHNKFQEILGSEVLDSELLNYQITTQEIIVIKTNMVGRPVSELNLVEDYGCYATGLQRANIHLPVTSNTVLQKGDRLEVTGEKSRLNNLAKEMGYVEKDIEQTDLVTFAFGIVGGILLGMVMIKLRTISIGLGSAGGLLLIGIAVGYISSLNPTFGRVPAAARHLLMELGLVIFMAGVGINSGGGVVEALLSAGPPLILCGAAVTIIPFLLAYFYGRSILKMNTALLLGAITGAMTSTPAMSILTSEARSGVPALGYAGTYTFANVLLTMAGALILLM
jgi:putative transport protein